MCTCREEGKTKKKDGQEEEADWTDKEGRAY